MSTAPRTRSCSPTVDLPDAIPPVRPITVIDAPGSGGERDCISVHRRRKEKPLRPLGNALAESAHIHYVITQVSRERHGANRRPRRPRIGAEDGGRVLDAG